MTKTELRRMSDSINAVLGTTIDFTKLKRDDLVALFTITRNPRAFLVNVGLQAGRERVKQRVMPLVQGLLESVLAAPEDALPTEETEDDSSEPS